MLAKVSPCLSSTCVNDNKSFLIKSAAMTTRQGCTASIGSRKKKCLLNGAVLSLVKSWQVLPLSARKKEDYTNKSNTVFLSLSHWQVKSMEELLFWSYITNWETRKPTERGGRGQGWPRWGGRRGWKEGGGDEEEEAAAERRRKRRSDSHKKTDDETDCSYLTRYPEWQPGNKSFIKAALKRTKRGTSARFSSC